MSNELSASETTPLRRPESRISEDELTSPYIESFSPIRNNFNSINITNNQNNLLIDSELHSRNITNNNNNFDNSRSNNRSSMTMDNVNKRILMRISLDVLVLLCVGFPILIFYLLGTPYKRGFFCDDESLKHPYKESTVRNWMLYIIGLVLPIGGILTVEVTRALRNTKKSNGNNIMTKYVFRNFEIPEWMVQTYKKVGVFGFGACATQLVTDIAKYSIGRLRPHFFNVCQPIMSNGSTCEDPMNAGKYIVDFSCRGVGSTERMLREVRLSFPSGHSSFTFFTMVYLALYLQARWHWKGSKLLRHAIQLGLILIAWFTALSRVSDYKHHWSDVLAGTVIGALVAVVVARYISDLFVERPEKSFVLPRTSQDMAPQSYTANGH